jgi:hypothetical protein
LISYERRINSLFAFVIRNSSFVILFGVSGGIKSAHASAILTIPAAMRITGSTHFPFLKRKSTRSMTVPALSGALAVRAFFVGFWQFTPPHLQAILVLAMGTVK